MPKRTKRVHVIFVSLVILIPILMFGLWLNSDISAIHQVNNQLEQLITRHDKKEMERVAADKETLLFLENLSRGNELDTSKTSDNQGGLLTNDGFVTVYYVAEINHQNVNVYLKSYDGFWNTFFPKLVLYQVSLVPQQIPDLK